MSTNQHNTAAPADDQQPKSRKITPDQLRGMTTMTRDVALASMSSEEKAIFEGFLAGDQEAIKQTKDSKLSSALHNAHLHARADLLDVQAVIESTVQGEDPTQSLGNGLVNVSLGPGVAVIPGSQISSVLGPVLANPSLAPVLGPLLVGQAANTPGSGVFTSAGYAVASPADVQNAILDWQAIYGVMRGEVLYNVFKASRNCESKTAMLVLMDMGLIDEKSSQKISFPVIDEVTGKKTYQVIDETFLVSILKSQSIPLIECLVEHGQGVAMLKAAQTRLRSYKDGDVAKLEDKSLLNWVYRTQDMLFDDRLVELLDGFLSHVGGANMSKPDDYAKPPRKWLSFLAYKVTEEDIDTLQMLVDKHNLQLNVYDQYGGTPYLRAAVMGNLPLIKFLQANPPIDVLAVERMSSHDAKSALDYAMAGPGARAKQQEYTQRQNEEDLEAYADTTIPEWMRACEAAVAKGEEPPPQPEQPEPDPIPDDYPLELITIVQEATALADPTLFNSDIADPAVKQVNALDALAPSADDDLDLSGF